MKNKKYVIGIDVVIFIIFLMLKLDGIIDWKWIWIFSPFWIVWYIQGYLWVVAVLRNIIAVWEPKNLYHAPSGDPLVWDAKTNTLYGPWNNKTEEEQGKW